MKFLKIMFLCSVFAPQVCAMDLAGLAEQLHDVTFPAAEVVLKPHVQQARQSWLTCKQQMGDGEHNLQNMLDQLDQLHQDVSTLGRLAALKGCPALATSCSTLGQRLLMAIVDQAKETGELLPDGAA